MINAWKRKRISLLAVLALAAIARERQGASHRFV